MRQNLVYFAGFRQGLDNPNRLVIHAGTNETYVRDAVFTAYIDGKEVPVKYVIKDNNRARFCYKSENIIFSCELQFSIIVPDDFKKATIRVQFSERLGGMYGEYSVSGKRFNKLKNVVAGAVDTAVKDDKEFTINGWAADDKDVSISVLDGSKPVDCNIQRYLRKDIVDYYDEEELKNVITGFEIKFPRANHKRVKIVLDAGGKTADFKVDLTKKSGANGTIIANKFNVLMRYLRQRGFSATLHKVFRKLLRINVFDYDRWIKDHSVTKHELSLQMLKQFEIKPLFSIVVPVYRPKPVYFEEMLKSVLDQTYTNFEICLADGGGEGHFMDKVVEKVCKGDKRVKYVKLEKNLGISENTNKALELATGDYIVLGDHDDIIRPDALYECAYAINEDPKLDVIYSDEDKYDCDKRRRIEPHFKPDFSLDMLRNNNYICHLFVFSRKLYEKVGGFNSKFDGSQDYDMILRCCENTKYIKHIPKVLYTWRCHAQSTALNPESKSYAHVAGLEALKAHLERQGVKAEVEMMDIPGYHKIKYDIIGNPFVSIIIPTKDHIDDLDTCLHSILDKQDFTNYEIIIIENNSTDPETFEYYKKIEAEYDKVKVYYWKEGFNYSKLNNFALQFAKGDYLLLLNNDTEMMRKDCLRELISYATRPEVGIVGARLLYNDSTIQHAGVVIGLGGVAGHAFAGVVKEDNGYFARAIIPQNYCAVTAACLMVRRSVYEEVGGFEEDLVVCFNDVDFCLKVWNKGYLVVYNPAAELYHYESKSRGFEDTPEKAARFKKEVDYITAKWQWLIDAGDPFYNVNLSLTRADFQPKE